MQLYIFLDNKAMYIYFLANKRFPEIEEHEGYIYKPPNFLSETETTVASGSLTQVKQCGNMAAYVQHNRRNSREI